MILYHFSRPPEGVKILQEGKFRLSPAHTLDSETQISGSHLFFLSTARARQNAYTGKKAVMFELDGQKLKQNYKTMPVHYWNDIKLSESEERIVSNSPVMPIRPYVKAVHVWKDPNMHSDLRKMLIAAKRHGIEIYVYETHADMISTQPTRRTSGSDLTGNAPAPGRREAVPDFLKSLKLEEEQRNSLTVHPYLALFYIAESDMWHKVSNKLPKEVREVLNRILDAKGSFGKRAVIGDLEKRARNVHVHGPNSKAARLAHDLARRLKQKNITLKQLPDFVRDSYEDYDG